MTKSEKYLFEACQGAFGKEFTIDHFRNQEKVLGYDSIAEIMDNYTYNEDVVREILEQYIGWIIDMDDDTFANIVKTGEITVVAVTDRITREFIKYRAENK